MRKFQNFDENDAVTNKCISVTKGNGVFTHPFL